ncbi:hypothetical protein EBR25_05775 [bacterium]|nr:hypothetical protein [bacterium]
MINPESGASVPPAHSCPLLNQSILQNQSVADSREGVGPSLHSVKSLGLSVVHAHGIATDGASVLLCNSYVNGPFTAGDVVQNILPDPSGDAYLHFTAIPTLAAKETLVTLTIQPGLLDYYERVGLLSPEANIIEVNPDRRIQQKAGFPFSDPITLLKAKEEEVRILSSDTYFVATFPTSEGIEFSLQNKCLGIQNFNPAELNNKALFRESAQKFDFRVLEGCVIRSDHDLKNASALLSGDYWLKLSCGSGGDLVKSFSTDRGPGLDAALSDMRRSVEAAFSSAEFPESSQLRDFWPKERNTPLAQELVIERDARQIGKVVLNGSMNVLLRHDGTTELVDFFRQNTASDGSYRGSERFDPKVLSPEILEDILEQGKRVFHYAHASGYRGYAGFDFFIVDTPEAGPTVYCIELNARPTMSTVPALTAKKLAALWGERHEGFINVNITAHKPLLSFDDFEEVFTISGENLTDPQNNTGVTVVPLAMRSLFARSGNDYENIVSSPKAKILVTAETNEIAWSMLEQIQQRGSISIGG